MIIVSQNKISISNFENITTIETNKYTNGDVIIRAHFNNGRLLDLVIYKTEERAREVLQEIISKYKQWNKDANNAVTIIPKVYEMPKK